jgi:hypothetical protein
MRAGITDPVRRAFLNELDRAPLEVTEWEPRFIEDTFDLAAFSYKQRQIIDRMIEHYGEEIGF